MKEQAEKEWYKYDLQRSDATSAWLSREAYKSALRAEIEKQNKDKEFPQMLWTISEILNLIDNVTPKQCTPRKQKG